MKLTYRCERYSQLRYEYDRQVVILAKYLVTTVVSCVTILTDECSAGKGYMQWELILEYSLLASCSEVLA